VLRDVRTECFQIRYRRFGPNYLEVHALAQD
jgi:hypothetical protein